MRMAHFSPASTGSEYATGSHGDTDSRVGSLFLEEK